MISLRSPLHVSSKGTLPPALSRCATIVAIVACSRRFGLGRRGHFGIASRCLAFAGRALGLGWFSGLINDRSLCGCGFFSRCSLCAAFALGLFRRGFWFSDRKLCFGGFDRCFGFATATLFGRFCFGGCGFDRFGYSFRCGDVVVCFDTVRLTTTSTIATCSRLPGL